MIKKFVIAVLLCTFALPAVAQQRPTAIQMLGQQIGAIVAQNAELMQQNGDLQEQVARLKARVAELEAPATPPAPNPK